MNLAQLSQHQADRGQAQEREGFAVQAFPILGEPTASVQPSDGSLDNPALRQDDEPLCRIRALDDLDLNLAHDPAQPILELRPLIAAIGTKLAQERVQAEHGRHQEHAAVAALNVGRMHDGVQQQALGVYRDVALLAFGPLAAIVARRVDAGPPFSALSTLWLSMIATVGLASRPAKARHRT